jgi:hypothetical protein
VFIASGASSAAWAEAGFADLRDRAFDGGPELGQLLEKEILRVGMGGNGAAHVYGICNHIPSCNKKMMPEKICASIQD